MGKQDRAETASITRVTSTDNRIFNATVEETGEVHGLKRAHDENGVIVCAYSAAFSLATGYEKFPRDKWESWDPRT